MACNTTTPESSPVWKFSIDRAMNTGTMSVTDPLIDSEAIAMERAASDFLKNSYSSNELSFVTGRNDLALNDEISVDGIVYLVKGISININSIRALYSVTSRRYD